MDFCSVYCIHIDLQASLQLCFFASFPGARAAFGGPATLDLQVVAPRSSLKGDIGPNKYPRDIGCMLGVDWLITKGPPSQMKEAFSL